MELFPGGSSDLETRRDLGSSKEYSIETQNSSTAFWLHAADFSEEEIEWDLQVRKVAEGLAAAAAPIPIPAARHHKAPQFMEYEPRELGKYFKELETLLANTQIAGDVGRKKQVIRYLKVNTADTWKSLVSYGPGESYEDWKKEVTDLYPGVNDYKCWMMVDMDKLVREKGGIGI